MFLQEADFDKRRFYGSGFIVTSDGYVVTNKHVTRNGISYVVTFVDGRQFPADLVAQAVANDIAVLKIRSNETWTPVSWVTVIRSGAAMLSSRSAIRLATRALSPPASSARSTGIWGILSSTITCRLMLRSTRAIPEDHCSTGMGK